MSFSPNLGFALILTAQAQKEVTANTALVALDQATDGTTTKALTTAATLTAAQATSAVLKFTGAPSGSCAVTIPALIAGGSKIYLVINETGQDVVLGYAIGATVTVATGTAQLVYCNGTAVFAMAAAYTFAGTP